MDQSKLPSKLSMEQLPSALAERLGELYREFSKYPFDRNMSGDPAFPFLTDNAVLQKRPLRELTPDDFHYYFQKAITTWGTIDDFKHFIPRLLELMAQKYFGLVEVDPFWILTKLCFAAWRQWPNSEQIAVCATFETLFYCLLKDSHPTRYDQRAFQLFEGITECTENLSPYTKLVDQNASSAVDLQLAYYFLDTKYQWLESATNQTDFDPRRALSARQRQVAEWLSKSTIRDRFEIAFFKCPQPENAEIFSAAVYWHDLWTKLQYPGD